MSKYFTFEIKVHSKIFRVTTFPKNVLINNLEYFSICKSFHFNDFADYSSYLECIFDLNGLIKYTDTKSLDNLNNDLEKNLYLENKALNEGKDLNIDDKDLNIDAATGDIYQPEHFHVLENIDSYKNNNSNSKTISEIFLDKIILVHTFMHEGSVFASSIEAKFENIEKFKCYEVQILNQDSIKIKAKSILSDILHAVPIKQFSDLCNANFGDVRCGLKEKAKPLEANILLIEGSSITLLLNKSMANDLMQIKHTVFHKIFNIESLLFFWQNLSNRTKIRSYEIIDSINLENKYQANLKESMIFKSIYQKHKEKILDDSNIIIKFYSFYTFDSNNLNIDDLSYIGLGCDKTVKSCQKYKNFDNFRGFPPIM